MKVERKSFGSKILSSFVTAIIGLVVFLGSFVVLYINEGREDLGKVASAASEVTQEGHSLDKGTLIGVKGSITASAYAGDTYLAQGEYVYIARTVEMYAYIEEEHRESKDNLGGSTTTTTTYSYKKEWTLSPRQTSTFQGDANELPGSIPADYNQKIASMPEQAHEQGEQLKMGRYTLMDNVEFSGSKQLKLTQDKINAEALEHYALTSSYLFLGDEGISPTSARLGDYRISYLVIDSSDIGILLGAADGDSISAFITPKEHQLYRFFAGAGSLSEAVQILTQEHKTVTWILRLVGFLMMFLGLIAMTGPITKFLSVVPVFSKISGFIFGVIAFFVSLVLTTVIVVISMVLHNFFLALGVAAILIAVAVILIVRKRSAAAGKK